MTTIEDQLGYTPEVRNSTTEKNRVDAISSRLLDWMNLSGKTTEGGAVVSTCYSIDEQREKYYQIRHVWSIYDLEKGSYKEAMNNIRRQLPLHGWEVTKDEPTKSQAQNPQIIAVNEKTNHTAIIEWAQRKDDPENELIKVNVDSRCMEGTDGDALGRT